MEENPNIYAYQRIDELQEIIVYYHFINQELTYDDSYVHEDFEVLIQNYDHHDLGKLKAYEAIVFIQNI